MSRYAAFRRRQESLSGVHFTGKATHVLARLYSRDVERRRRGTMAPGITGPALAMLYWLCGCSPRSAA